jgi:hypothetical protein
MLLYSTLGTNDLTRARLASACCKRQKKKSAMPRKIRQL